MDLVKFALFTTTISPLLVIQQQALAAPMCKDLNSKCSTYKAKHCTRYSNIKQQCPLTCNQCGTLHPSSPVTPMTSSHLIDATQSTAVRSQSLTTTQMTGSISQVTSVSQSLTPTHSTVSESQVLTVVLSQIPPTQNTKMVRSSSEGHNNIKTQNVVRATASKTDLTQAILLIMLGILCRYLFYWC